MNAQKKIFLSASSQTMRMFYLILDCTEIFIEEPSQIIQQSCTWSEYKGHNTGKGLIAISPLLLPVFVSEVFPESKSDKNILRDSGIQSLTQQGDKWLADKGFIVQNILDNEGVIDCRNS